MLEETFQWPVDKQNPELGFCPVVVLGHALHGDMAMLKSTLGFDAMALGTVVKIIDTQNLAKECEYAPSGNGNQIGLGNLVAKCSFEYRDPHTASNDAAMTLISAVQMLLPSELKPDDGGLQKVVDNIEVDSQWQEWDWGDDQWCLRCGQYGHTRDDYRGKRCFAKVKCSHCTASQLRNAGRPRVVIERSAASLMRCVGRRWFLQSRLRLPLSLAWISQAIIGSYQADLWDYIVLHYT